MKKSLFVLAISLFSVAFSKVQASEPSSISKGSDSGISVQDLSDMRLKVLFGNALRNTAGIEIYNSQGEVFYQDINTTAKPVVLNLTHLEDGIYTLSVVVGNDKLTYDFNIESQVKRVAVLKK